MCVCVQRVCVCVYACGCMNGCACEYEREEGQMQR